MRRLLYLLVIWSVLTACLSKEDKNLNNALELAGENRQELEKVLLHYKDDSLKLKAAQFLIENMPYHYYFESDRFELFKKQLYTVISERGLSGEESLEYLNGKQRQLSNTDFLQKNDAQTITAQYLINDIDFAFTIWRKQPWGKSIPFDVFCQDILPYRIADEPLEEWREEYYNYFQPILDSLMTDSSAVSACQIIYDTIDKQKWFFIQELGTPHIGGKALLNYRYGSCREYSDIALYAMRALGIAGGVNMILQNPNFYFTHHYWNYLRDAEGKLIRFELYNERPGFVNDSRIRGKVYKRCFDLPKTTLPYLYPDKEIPKTLKELFLSDAISSEYYPGYNINIPINRDEQKDNILYLCVYNRTNWIPVCWTEIEDGNATFLSVEPGIIFLPAYYIKGKIYPVSDPVSVDKDFKLKTFKTKLSQYEEITVTRKSFTRQSLKEIGQLAINGKFQGANRADFKDATTLYTIKEKPEMKYYEYNLDRPQKFRYLRYLSSEDSTCCNMAEIQFYAPDGQVLKGAIIGSDGFSGDDPKLTKEALFDDDPLTYFQSKEPTSAWGGLDLKQQQMIGKIRYLFRNDDNTIRDGDQYELLYFTKDKGMVSLGIQTGNREQKLTFKNVPVGALLWLHDRTRGQEECFFLYENHKQVWQ